MAIAYALIYYYTVSIHMSTAHLSLLYFWPGRTGTDIRYYSATVHHYDRTGVFNCQSRSEDACINIFTRDLSESLMYRYARGRLDSSEHAHYNIIILHNNAARRHYRPSYNILLLL